MAVTLGEKCLLDCDLILVKGASFEATVTWERDGQAVDLTGATCLCQIRQENDSEVLADISDCWTFGDGTASLIIDDGTSATIPEGKWPWDLMVTESGGWTTRVLAGKCTVVDPISEDA